MSKSILVIDTPKSCSECRYRVRDTDGVYCVNGIEELCPYGRKYNEYEHKVHPLCPLQDTTELLEALEELSKNMRFESDIDAYNKLHEALGGK